MLPETNTLLIFVAVVLFSRNLNQTTLHHWERKEKKKVEGIEVGHVDSTFKI